MARAEPRTMTFLEHLEELRRRLWWGIAFVAVGIVVAYVFRRTLMTVLLDPFTDAWRDVRALGAALPEEPMVHYRSMAEPFFTDLKVSLLGGAYVGLPLLAWQVWLFVAPGLLPKEKRYAVPFLFFAYVFFTGGAAFCYYVILPIAYRFFFGYASSMDPGLAVNPTVMINDYVGFAITMLAAFGAAFELPLFIAILSLLHIVDWRQLVRYIRWAIVLTLVVGGILTPPDPLSQILMAVPLMLLYGLSILLSFFLWPQGHAGAAPRKKPGKKEKAAAAQQPGDGQGK